MILFIFPTVAQDGLVVHMVETIPIVHGMIAIYGNVL